MPHDESQFSDEFYVGYLPMPPRLARTLRRSLILACLLLLVVSGGIAITMRSAGAGNWDLDHVSTIEGTLLTEPYVMIVPAETDAHHSNAIVVVEEGKLGPRKSILNLANKRVRLKGHLLVRDKQRVFELLADGEAITLISNADEGSPASAHSALVTLVGELIDPKCFTGAMKPGDQKTHKSCAVLCLRGGIPPMFVMWNEAGAITTLLLTDEDGKPLIGERLEQIIPFVGDLIEAQGTIVRTNGGVVFRMNLASTKRL